MTGEDTWVMVALRSPAQKKWSSRSSEHSRPDPAGLDPGPLVALLALAWLMLVRVGEWTKCLSAKVVAKLYEVPRK